MRRKSLIVPIAALILMSVVLLPQAQAKNTGLCKFQSVNAEKWTVNENHLIVRCVASRIGLPVSTALLIVSHESGFNEDAYNSSGCNGAGCLGLFQQHAGYWSGRLAAARGWLRRLHVHSSSWRNPVVNTVVSAVMAKHSGGWSSGWCDYTSYC